MKNFQRFPLKPQGALLLAFGLLLQGTSAMAQQSSQPNPNPPPSRQAGSVNFDVADRLAITNTIFAMTSALDEKDVALLLAQLTPDFSAEYIVPGEGPLSVKGRENFGKMMAKRFENQVAIGMNRRHVITPLFFIEQNADTARILLHVITCTATNQSDWRPFSSAKVEFRLRKEKGTWLACGQLETLDCPLDLPISKLVPIPQASQ